MYTLHKIVSEHGGLYPSMFSQEGCPYFLASPQP